MTCKLYDMCLRDDPFLNVSRHSFELKPVSEIFKGNIHIQALLRLSHSYGPLQVNKSI